MRPLVIASLLLLALSADAQRVHAVKPPPPQRLLWIGAHPDDEGLVAPIFGRACVERDGRCAVIVLTSGSAVRSAELQEAARNLHAEAIQLDYADVFDVHEWGPSEAIVARLVGLIRSERPTTIYTFDPRHGSSCHPAHRAAGELVLQAAAALGNTAPPIILVETLIERGADLRISGFGPATEAALAIDATSTWHYLVDDAASHRSQFDDDAVAALRAIPADQRRVWILSAASTAAVPQRCQ